MKEGTSPEVPKARESRGEPRVGRVRGSGPCRGVIERPGGSRHDIFLTHFTGKSLGFDMLGMPNAVDHEGEGRRRRNLIVDIF